MIWTRNGYESPPSGREFAILQAAVDELSEQVADLAQKNFDLQIQVSDLEGRIDTMEECLGWFEAELS